MLDEIAKQSASKNFQRKRKKESHHWIGNKFVYD